MDDIEIWEVCRSNSSRECDWQHKLQHESALKMLTWGDKLEVEAKFFNGPVLRIAQEVSGTIGSVLWPSSVVLSRLLMWYIMRITTTFDHSPP